MSTYTLKVSALRSRLQTLKSLREQIVTKTQQREQLTRELEKLTEDEHALAKSIVDELHALDVAQNGNFGWEKRVLVFLSELAGG